MKTPKSVKSKTPKPVVSCTHEGTRAGWHKYHFYFASIEACNQVCLQMAALMRNKWPKVYFARYTNALESRLDIYVWCNLPLSQTVITKLMAAHVDTHWTIMEGPIKCEGSDAHAAGFDFVMKFVGHALDLKLEPPQVMALWNDTLHWMHNMVGYDYVDESRCHLNALLTITQIFDDSIKLGNKMAKVARTTAKRSKHPTNN